MLLSVFLQRLHRGLRSLLWSRRLRCLLRPLCQTHRSSPGAGVVSLCRVSSLHLNTWSGAQLSTLSPPLSPAPSGPFGADGTAVSGNLQTNARSWIPPLTAFFSPRIFKQQKITNLQRFLRPSHPSSSWKTRPRIHWGTLQDTFILLDFFFLIWKTEKITPMKGDFLSLWSRSTGMGRGGTGHSCTGTSQGSQPVRGNGEN